ncbi:MAG: hypothetical protein RR612_08685 [Oscillospiraceae bacterium]
MIKTNPNSRFLLLTLDQIKDSCEVILQTEKTDAIFTEKNKTCYLCEVVSGLNYHRQTLENAVTEIIRLNRILGYRNKRIKFLENKIKAQEEGSI